MCPVFSNGTCHRCGLKCKEAEKSIFCGPCDEKDMLESGRQLAFQPVLKGLIEKCCPIGMSKAEAFYYAMGLAHDLSLSDVCNPDDVVTAEIFFRKRLEDVQASKTASAGT
jgi:hypothetical protein